MAKDPRFNFYPDNYLGGTTGFTLEQHGAYMQLIIFNFHKGPFTEAQALDRLAELTRGNTAVYTELWKFLLPKFATDGEFFWSERLMKEKTKSRVHSEKQAERVKKRWNPPKDDSGSLNGNTVVLPVNGTGSGNGIGSEKEERVQGEKPTDPQFQEYEQWTKDVSDGQDSQFEEMLYSEPNKAKIIPRLRELAEDHLGLLARYPKIRPPDQHRFRKSLMKHIRENYQNQKHVNNGRKNTNAAGQIVTGQQRSSTFG
jgi:uncharacterized protein YdaU (DUF1376 family)